MPLMRIWHRYETADPAAVTVRMALSGQNLEHLIAPGVKAESSTLQRNLRKRPADISLHPTRATFTIGSLYLKSRTGI